jgi:hypothetical protein
MTRSWRSCAAWQAGPSGAVPAHDVGVRTLPIDEGFGALVRIISAAAARARAWSAKHVEVRGIEPLTLG